MKIDARFIAKLSPQAGDLLIFEAGPKVDLCAASRALGPLLPKGVKCVLVRDLKLLSAEDLAQLSMLIENAQIRKQMEARRTSGVQTVVGKDAGKQRRKRNPGDGQ